MRKQILFTVALIFSLCAYASQYNYSYSRFYSSRISSLKISRNAKGLNNKVLNLALTAYLNAKDKGLTTSSILTIVDFSIPSNEPRLWVIDLDTSSVKVFTHVAHGRASGLKVANSFSNKSNSYKSSLGLFITGKTYHGAHGLSLRLHGLEKNINDNAYKRTIVVHTAKYASESFIEKNGRMGRSLGCFTVKPEFNKKVISEIKEGSLIFAYYPDKAWLSNSDYL